MSHIGSDNRNLCAHNSWFQFAGEESFETSGFVL